MNELMSSTLEECDDHEAGFVDKIDFLYDATVEARVKLSELAGRKANKQLLGQLFWSIVRTYISETTDIELLQLELKNRRKAKKKAQKKAQAKQAAAVHGAPPNEFEDVDQKPSAVEAYNPDGFDEIVVSCKDLEKIQDEYDESLLRLLPLYTDPSAIIFKDEIVAIFLNRFEFHAKNGTELSEEEAFDYVHHCFSVLTKNASNALTGKNDRGDGGIGTEEVGEEKGNDNGGICTEETGMEREEDVGSISTQISIIDLTEDTE